MRKTTVDYYSLLNISKDASIDEIKKSYRLLAHQFHPDKNSGDTEAEEKFKEINRAYNVLSDPQKRLFYDRTGSESNDSMYGNMQGYGNGCGRKKGFGCGKFRNKHAWNFFRENLDLHDILITKKEAKTGIEISVSPQTDSENEAFKVRLPQNIQNGSVFQCLNSKNGDTVFVRVIYADE